MANANKYVSCLFRLVYLIGLVLTCRTRGRGRTEGRYKGTKTISFMQQSRITTDLTDCCAAK